MKGILLIIGTLLLASCCCNNDYTTEVVQYRQVTVVPTVETVGCCEQRPVSLCASRLSCY